MENPEVAQAFDETADLLELQGANPFRIRAYRTAARTIRDVREPLLQLACGASPRRLEDLPGIGADLAGKITDGLRTGRFTFLDELRRQVPAGLRDLMRVPGLGPKKAQTLFHELHVDSIAKLRRAAEQHRLRQLAGFGPKTESNVLQALATLDESSRRMLLCDAKIYAEAVTRHLAAVPGVSHVTVAGSYRRCKETVGDLDILVICHDPALAMDRLATFERIASIVARGGTKMTVRLQCGLQMDLRVVPDQSFGAALAYFTGSKAHNIAIRRLGMQRGLKINEYGVFRGRRFVAGRTEDEVYAAVGLPWIPPELREARGEIELALAGELPTLLELRDMRGDLHTHTNATDGRASLDDMVRAAAARGYDYVAITDHSKRVTMARGLDARRLRHLWRKIDRLAERTPDLRVLKGVEVDILENGEMDLPDDVLAEADWVVAAIHYGQNQPKQRITQRLINAVRNPFVHAIAHPTGRLIGQRNGYDVDLETVFKEAADYGCLMELNCQPTRLDLDDVALMAAKARGVKIVLSTDAHATEEFGFMEFGVGQARRAGLEAKDVANTRSYVQFRKLLKR